MSRKLPGSAIVPGTITVTQITGGLNDTTNASYAQANTARTTANDAYGQANTARADANTTFGTINTTFGTVNSSFGTVNTNYQAAYAQANTARTTANDAYGAANTKLSTSGGSISGDLAITGNLTVQGNATTINVSNLSVNDSIILLSTNAVGDSNDIGFIGHFDRGATETHAGLIRKATENRFYLFDNYEVEPSNNVIDVAGNNFRVGNLRLGIINANSFVTAAGLDVTGQANAAYGQANAAYGAANNRVLKAGDTMTGQLNISSGGLLVTGNVGIGTASPAYVLSTSSSAHGQYSQHRQSSGTGVGQEMYYMFNDSSGAAVNYASIYAELAANTAGSHTGKIALRTVTAGTLSTKLLVDQTGNVGIGTTSPGQKLEVAGNILVNTSGNPYAEIKTSGSGNNPYLKLTADTNSWTFQGTFSNANDDLLVLYNATTLLDLDKNGNLGIGTASPTSRLHVVSSTPNSGNQSLFINQQYGNTGDSSSQIRMTLNSGAGGGYMTAYDADFQITHNSEFISGSNWVARSTTASALQQASGVFVFYSNQGLTAGNAFTPTERARITIGGDLCVGSTEPGNAGTRNISIGNPGTTVGGLQLWSTTSGTHYVQFGDSASGGAPYSGAIGYTHTDNALLFYTNQSLRATLDSVGNFALKGAAGTYSLDTTFTVASYANGATVDFPSMSGMIIANDQLSTGYVTIWLVGGGNTTAAASHGGTPVGSMAYNAAVAGYRWTNNSGETRSVAFAVFRTRNTA